MRKIIIPLPTGSTDADKAERSHLMASRWATLTKNIPRGELFAGKVYAIDDDEAASLVRKGVAKYVDASGKATDEQAPPAPAGMPRAGTQAWKDLPADQRVGSDEWREIQFQKNLDAAAVVEADALAKQVAPTTPAPTPVAPAPEITEPVPNGRK